MNQYTIYVPENDDPDNQSKHFSLRDEAGRLLGIMHVNKNTVSINGLKIRVQKIEQTPHAGETKTF